MYAEDCNLLIDLDIPIKFLLPKKKKEGAFAMTYEYNWAQPTKVESVEVFQPNNFVNLFLPAHNRFSATISFFYKSKKGD